MAPMGTAEHDGLLADARHRTLAATSMIVGASCIHAGAGRYMAVETAVSVAVNAVLNTAPAAISLGLQAGVPILGADHLTFGAVPQVFMGAFMSALVPSLLTHRRSVQGRLARPAGRDAPTLPRIVSTSLCLAAASTGLGLLLIGALLPRLAEAGLPVAAKLLLYAAFGGCVASLVTPSALLLTFGPCRGKDDGRARRAPA